MLRATFAIKSETKWTGCTGSLHCSLLVWLCRLVPLLAAFSWGVLPLSPTDFFYISFIGVRMALLQNVHMLMYFVMAVMRKRLSKPTLTYYRIQKAFVIDFTCGSIALGSQEILCPEKTRHSRQQAEEEACLAQITVHAGSALADRCAQTEGSKSGCPFWVCTCPTPAPP